MTNASWTSTRGRNFFRGAVSSNALALGLLMGPAIEVAHADTRVLLDNGLSPEERDVYWHATEMDPKADVGLIPEAWFCIARPDGDGASFGMGVDGPYSSSEKALSSAFPYLAEAWEEQWSNWLELYGKAKRRQAID